MRVPAHIYIIILRRVGVYTRIFLNIDLKFHNDIKYFYNVVNC